MSQKFRVRWEYKNSAIAQLSGEAKASLWEMAMEQGTCGEGEPIEHSSALAWVEEMNKQYPDIRHWIVPA